jgi:PAS domain S-box-containing protein
VRHTPPDIAWARWPGAGVLAVGLALVVLGEGPVEWAGVAMAALGSLAHVLAGRAVIRKFQSGVSELQLLAAQTPANVWTTDAELRLTSVFGTLIQRLENPAAHVPGRTLYDLFETRDETHPAIAAHLRALRGESASYERVAGDLVLEGRVEPLRDQKGRIIGCVGTAMDVSTWRWAERQVRRFASLVQSSEDAIISTDLAGTIETWNPAAERLYGYTATETVGKPMTILAPPGGASEIERNILALRQGAAVGPYDTQRLRRDGRMLDVSVTVSPIRDERGHVLGASGIVRDITERKHTEDALRESEGRFRSVLDRMRLFGLGLNVEGRVAYCNDYLLEMTGWSRSEVFGADWLSQFLPPDTPVIAAFRFAMEMGEIPAQYVSDIITRDGGRRRVQWNNTLVRDDEGTVTGVVGIGEDVTERNRVVEELRRSQAELRALAQRLNSLREDEHTRMARELHDGLGQALTALRLDLAWLARRLPDASPAVRQKIGAMTAIVDDTIETGRSIVAELRPPILDDLGLAPSLEWYVHRFAKRAGLKCEWDPGPAELFVDRDVAVVAYRIVQEALTNVARHAEAKCVAVQLGEEDGELTVEIRDDGRGISEQASANPRSLGFVGMRERALARGGSLEVSRLPEGGTSVRLTIPIERPPAPRAPQ